MILRICIGIRICDSVGSPCFRTRKRRRSCKRLRQFAHYLVKFLYIRLVYRIDVYGRAVVAIVFKVKNEFDVGKGDAFITFGLRPLLFGVKLKIFHVCVECFDKSGRHRMTCKNKSCCDELGGVVVGRAMLSRLL